VPLVHLWRRDVRYRPLDVGPEPPLAPAVADHNCSGAPVAPLADAVPDVVLSRPTFIASLLGASVAAPRCYLLTRDGELVSDVLETGRTRDQALADYEELRTQLESPRRGTPRRIALVGSQRMHAYFHWWIDVLPRIWLLDTFGGDEAARVPLALPPLRPFHRATIDLLGLGDRVTILEPGVARFREVIFTPGITGRYPEHPSSLVKGFSEWVRGRLRLGEAEPGDGPRALFVGRRDGRKPRRRVINEEAVREYLTRRGVTCIDGGRLPIEEQAQLFGGARTVIGPHGAGLTNLIFCRPGTRVVELFPAAGARPLSCYRLLASHLGLPYTRLVVESANTPRDGMTEKARALNDDMLVDVDCLGRCLDGLGV
jgi:capsular polysaccharide biosynthesis protein